MAYFGAVAVVLAVYMIWREYGAVIGGELDSCSRFLRALTDYRDKIRCYMDTPLKWALEYSDEELAKCGFLSTLAECGDFHSAYVKAKGSLTVTSDVDEVLSACFDRLGEGYLETEVDILDAAIDKLKTAEEKMRESFSKRRKAVGAMLGAFASGIVILAM